MSAALSDWYPEEEAARRMGMSTRTLRRMSARKVGPERRLRPRDGRKPEPVYNPQDVDKRASVQTPPYVVNVHYIRVSPLESEAGK